MPKKIKTNGKPLINDKNGNSFPKVHKDMYTALLALEDYGYSGEVNPSGGARDFAMNTAVYIYNDNSNFEDAATKKAIIDYINKTNNLTGDDALKVDISRTDFNTWADTHRKELELSAKEIKARGRKLNQNDVEGNPSMIHKSKHLTSSTGGALDISDGDEFEQWCKKTPEGKKWMKDFGIVDSSHGGHMHIGVKNPQDTEAVKLQTDNDEFFTEADRIYNINKDENNFISYGEDNPLHDNNKDRDVFLHDNNTISSEEFNSRVENGYNENGQTNNTVVQEEEVVDPLLTEIENTTEIEDNSQTTIGPVEGPVEDPLETEINDNSEIFTGATDVREEVENLVMDEGVFTGTINSETKEPIKGKIIFADGDTYEGDFNNDGTFNQGKYIDRDENLDIIETRDGVWNNDDTFSGTITDNANNERVGNFDDVDGVYTQTTETENAIQDEVTTIEEGEPKRPSRFDYPADPNKPSLGNANPETEGISWKEAQKKYDEDLLKYNETISPTNEETTVVEEEVTETPTVVAEEEVTETIPEVVEETIPEEITVETPPEVVTVETPIEEVEETTQVETPEVVTENPVAIDETEATVEKESDLDDEGYLNKKLREFKEKRTERIGYTKIGTENFEKTKKESRSIIKSTKEEIGREEWNAMSKEDRDAAILMAFINDETGNEELTVAQQEQVNTSLNSTYLTHGGNNYGQGDANISAAYLTELQKDETIYDENGNLIAKRYNNILSTKNDLTNLEEGEVILVGPGGNSGIDYSDTGDGARSSGYSNGGAGQHANTFYVVSMVDGKKVLTAYDPVKEKVIENSFNDEIGNEGFNDHLLNYTEEDINNFTLNDNAAIAKYVEENGYDKNFYDILVNQKNIKNPYKIGTQEHQDWNKTQSTGNKVWDEQNGQWIDHSMKRVKVDANGEVVEDGQSWNANNQDYQFDQKYQYQNGETTNLNSNQLSKTSLENRSVLVNNPFNPFNPDLNKRQQKREQQKYDAWNTQATLRGDEGELVYQWDQNGNNFGDPTTQDTRFNEIGYEPGQYTNNNGDLITVDGNGRAFIQRKESETADGIEYSDAEEMFATGTDYQDMEMVKAAKVGLMEKLKDPTVASSLISTVLGGVGLSMAMKKLDPKSMPSLSSAFEERLRQSKALSEQGFDPAEEAKIRQDINKSYSVGIDNMVRGTAGDRAKFLAGTGVLDAQRSSALLEFAALDSAQKRDNRKQYTDLLTYKENFEAQKTLSERTEDMNQQLANKQAGASLASSAFETVTNNIQGAKMNKFMGKYQDMMEDSLFGPQGATVLDNIFSHLGTEETETPE